MAAVATTRLAYSPEDIAGRALAIEMMAEAGLKVRVDAAGNILGERAGHAGLAPILFGSHIDTVRQGGRFDGILGVMAAIECVHVLNRVGGTLRHPLRVVIFANEEGQEYAGLSGSRGMVEGLSAAELDRTDRSGRSLREALAQIGGDSTKLDCARVRSGAIHAYVELHIEQGGELEEGGVSIGVVEGITGILHSQVVLSGAANHAGTTRMQGRRDALVAAAQLIVAVNAVAAEKKLCRVATVGQLSVLPNSRNIIPGEVRLVIELRDLDQTRMHAALEALKLAAKEIETAWRVDVKFVDLPLAEAVPAAPKIQDAIQEACQASGYSYMRMASGAGHDAQVLGRIAPMGMIFVPSTGGISHSPDEYTSYEDCARGANVLLQTIVTLDSAEFPTADRTSA
jgi:N-carbamoyl-L-amino-acid hydrolase